MTWVGQRAGPTPHRLPSLPPTLGTPKEGSAVGIPEGIPPREGGSRWFGGWDPRRDPYPDRRPASPRHSAHPRRRNRLCPHKHGTSRLLPRTSLQSVCAGLALLQPFGCDPNYKVSPALAQATLLELLKHNSERCLQPSSQHDGEPPGLAPQPRHRPLPSLPPR